MCSDDNDGAERDRISNRIYEENEIVAFAEEVLGMKLYDWQKECLSALTDAERTPVSVVAANGSGKTSNLVAPAVLWFLQRYPMGQAVITSGSFRQVEKQLWPAMRVHAESFPDWKFLRTEVKLPEGGFALGFSTDHAGRAEGWHPKAGAELDPVFIIVDEAKTVPNEIFEAFERCTRLFQLWVSSPGAPAGEFYESFHSNRKYFWTRSVPSTDCPHIDPQKRERDRERHGESSPLYRSMHLAEFTENVERLVLCKESLRDALEHPVPAMKAGENVAFFDFAAGRDENVFALREGNIVRIVKAWRESDTVQAVREFIRSARELGLQSSQCWGDADGLGRPMVDLMADEGFRINEFRGGMPARDSNSYANLISETWIAGARKIERGSVYLLEPDPALFKQLTNRMLEWDQHGKLRVESKQTMSKRGIKSPDRADAILGAIHCGAYLTGSLTSEVMEKINIPDSGFSSGGVRF